MELEIYEAFRSGAPRERGAMHAIMQCVEPLSDVSIRAPREQGAMPD